VVEEEERNFVEHEMSPYLAGQLDLDALFSKKSPQQYAIAIREVPEVVASKAFGSFLYLDRIRTESSTRFTDRLLETVSAILDILKS